MTGPEYREALKKLGLSINGAGRFFQAGPRSAHRWASEGCPPAISMMLKLMIALHVTPEWVNYWLGRNNDEEPEE